MSQDEQPVDPLAYYGGRPLFANVARVEVQGVSVKLIFGERTGSGSITNMESVVMPIDTFQQFVRNTSAIMQAIEAEANRAQG